MHQLKSTTDEQNPTVGVLKQRRNDVNIAQYQFNSPERPTAKYQNIISLHLPPSLIITSYYTFYAVLALILYIYTYLTGQINGMYRITCQC